MAKERIDTVLVKVGRRCPYSIWKPKPSSARSFNIPSSMSLYDRLIQNLLLCLLLRQLPRADCLTTATPLEGSAVPGDEDCGDWYADSHPDELYMQELFARMQRSDTTASDNMDGPNYWERIIATRQLDPVGTHLMTFNTTFLGNCDNLTMAKVVVATNRTNSCHASIKASRRQGTLPCENKPFQITNLATFDVTSLLASTLGENEFSVYVKRPSNIEEALLVVFDGIDTTQLFQEPRIYHCRVTGGRRKRAVSRSRLSKKRATGAFPSFHDRAYRVAHTRLNPSPSVQISMALRGHPAARYTVGSRVLPGHSAGSKDRSHKRASSYDSRRHSPTLGRFFSKNRQNGLYKDTSGPGVWRQFKKTGNSFNKMKSYNATRVSAENRENRRQVQREQKKVNRIVILGYKFKVERRRRPTISEILRSNQAEVHRTSMGHNLTKRQKRSALTSSDVSLELPIRYPGACLLKNFTVHPFYDLGQTGFVSPLELDIGRCDGGCVPILFPNARTPRYSHIISLLHSMSPVNATLPVSPPACRPAKFQSFSVMRFEDDDLLIERWRNARVIECACI